jgi:hypothetical protein
MVLDSGKRQSLLASISLTLYPINLLKYIKQRLILAGFPSRIISILSQHSINSSIT